MRRGGGADTSYSLNRTGTGAQGDDSYQERKRLKEGGRKESLDFNPINDDQGSSVNHDKRNTSSSATHQSSTGPDGFSEEAPQTRDPSTMEDDMEQPEPMDVDDSRDEAPMSFPPPPEGSVRTRCYKLNLDSEMWSLTGQSPKVQASTHGPFTEPPPLLTFTSSEDSSDGPTPTKIAIQTAQIFRGITVSRDGTILSQNARATRSSRGNKNKRGEKSRQAAKIDKANDLVEEVGGGGGNADSDSKPNMVSLVIMGEYDDMKYLIRDGSKRLREADGAGDDKLLAVNRPRFTQRTKSEPSMMPAAVTSPRKRSSATSSQGPNPRENSSNSHQRTGMTHAAGAASPNPGGNNPQGLLSPKTSAPKIKSHPRDTRSGRREERTSTRMRLDSCHDFMDPRRAEVVGDGDWSHAWNIWNCGGTGTVSPPNHPSSPLEGNKNGFEGRDSSHGSRAVREASVPGRAN